MVKEGQAEGDEVGKVVWGQYLGTCRQCLGVQMLFCGEWRTFWSYRRREIPSVILGENG